MTTSSKNDVALAKQISLHRKFEVTQRAFTSNLDVDKTKSTLQKEKYKIYMFGVLESLCKDYHVEFHSQQEKRNFYVGVLKKMKIYNIRLQTEVDIESSKSPFNNSEIYGNNVLFEPQVHPDFAWWVSHSDEEIQKIYDKCEEGEIDEGHKPQLSEIEVSIYLEGFFNAQKLTRNTIAGVKFNFTDKFTNSLNTILED